MPALGPLGASWICAAKRGRRQTCLAGRRSIGSSPSCAKSLPVRDTADSVLGLVGRLDRWRRRGLSLAGRRQLRRAIHLQGFVVAPMGAKPVVLLDALVEVLAHLVGEMAALVTLHCGLALIGGRGVAFGPGRDDCQPCGVSQKR